RELEPHCTGIRALWSPDAGIVDYREVVQHYALDVRNAGGEVHTGRELLDIAQRSRCVLLQTSAGELEARRVVVCAGLHADRVAALSGDRREPRIVPFRGGYWQLRPEARQLGRNLVYSVPAPGL